MVTAMVKVSKSSFLYMNKRREECVPKLSDLPQPVFRGTALAFNRKQSSTQKWFLNPANLNCQDGGE